MSTVTELEVLRPALPEGNGYNRTKVKFGKTLHRGKWLAISEGQGYTLGPDHVIVHHFRRRPRPYAQGDRIKNVLVNIHTGEASAEFERGRYVQSQFGLAVVFKKDDDRAYLLDASHGDLVSAMPEGAHDYVYGENYWLHLSAIAKRVWVIARASDEQVHLYEWENRREPPVVPNNPFPFVPGLWEPTTASGPINADSEEVRPSGPANEGCERAILIPPTAYECVEYHDRPLSDGWRYSERKRIIYNRNDGRGLDLSSVCTGQKRGPAVSEKTRSPPRVTIACNKQGIYLLWAPDRVGRIPEFYVREYLKNPLSLRYEAAADRYIYWPSSPGNITRLDGRSLQRELVGEYRSNYRTMVPAFHRGLAVFAIKQEAPDRRALWFDLIDTRSNLRGRVKAVDLAISRTGTAVAIVKSATGVGLVDLPPLR